MPPFHPVARVVLTFYQAPSQLELHPLKWALLLSTTTGTTLWF